MRHAILLIWSSVAFLAELTLNVYPFRYVQPLCARYQRFDVVEPPKLLGPHAPILVLKTSDDYACAPDNLT
jgi:hypothetical protein